MKIDDVPAETMPRILWIGPLSGDGLGPGHQSSAHELSLEAGLLRLRNSHFDAVVARLSTNIEAERLLDLLADDLSLPPFFVQLGEDSVRAAVLLAQAGAARVYGTETGADEIFQEACSSACELLRQTSTAALLPWRRPLIGSGAAMRRIVDVVARVAARKSTVLITGESGTGKEVIANAIHAAGDRAGRPFQAVNCSALPEGLLESELFGHTRGAFTGAVQNRTGLFERANGGTIFLDEIGDMPASLQAKLLRVLQERQVQPLGGGAPVRIDVRVIAATNCNLEKAIAEGRFREDLFYRLNVIAIQLPALRDRAEDIPALAAHFVEKICRSEGLPLKTLTPAALARLCRYNWPGNVRQLQNVIERAVVTGSGDRQIYPADIEIPEMPVSSAEPKHDEIDTRHGLDFEQTVGAFERAILQKVMNQTAGNKTRAAQLLRLGRTTLSAKLRVLGVAA